MRKSIFAALLVVPSMVSAGDPVPGVDVSLEQIPGGKYNNQSQCTSQPGNKVVIKNGKTYCQVPLAASHSNSRSNTPTVKVKKQGSGG